MAENKKYRIKKGDQVIVRTGKEKGKKGEVIRILTEKHRALVSGANMVKRHQRPSQMQAGGIVEKEASIHISNLSLIDPREGTATRVGYKTLENGEKVRFAKKSGEVIA